MRRALASYSFCAKRSVYVGFSGKEREMSELSETHDELLRRIVPVILTGPLDAGGDTADIMALLASITLAVVSVTASSGQEEYALDILDAEIRRRLMEQRLGRPRGNA